MKRFYVLIIILIAIIIPGLILYVGYTDLKKERKYSEEVLAGNYKSLESIKWAVYNEIENQYALDSCRVEPYYNLAKDFYFAYDYIVSEIQNEIDNDKQKGNWRDKLSDYLALQELYKYHDSVLSSSGKKEIENYVKRQDEYQMLKKLLKKSNNKNISKFELHAIKNLVSAMNIKISYLIVDFLPHFYPEYGEVDIFIDYIQNTENRQFYLGSANVAIKYSHKGGFVIVSRDYDSISQKYIGIIDTVKIDDYGPNKIIVDNDSIKEGNNELMLTYYWPNKGCRDKYDYVLLRKKFKFYKTE